MTDATNTFGGDSPSRLDRIESILARVAEQQAELQSELRETRAIADSNARSIQAWESKFETQDRDIDRLALVAADIESGTRTLAITVRDVFSVIMDRLERVEARLPDEGTNGGS